ncbi:ABC transporter substrate-binding protein [Actinocatenispora comari]|uniref:Amino acid ABC transporter substrate-binding protein n=1 Tax=Actinocatenispora comari TaxID=2807577 RepID=A0A8J4EQ94_9ACTN|nr:transporter substrate-binding domain-containing protein [Actinocatenispora comari]GIL31613.1 amino acid ABC transporter substrate-binding protein [Actinocatenispora comari]
MSSRSRRTLLVAGAVTLAAVGAGCAPQSSDSGSSKSSAKAASCTPDSLATKTKGTLTVATDKPAYPPWFIDNKPANGKGYESAVAYAVADKLGYAKDKVTWTVVSFNTAIAPGPKQYDIDVNEFSISPERRKAVDFSSPYYDVRQTVVALSSSKIAKTTSVAALKNAKLGAQVGTTSYQAITETVKPSVKPQVFNNNDDAKKALQNGQIDGLVVDLPTAFAVTAEIKGSTIVGQLPKLSGKPEQFGIVLDKGSPLTACVSKAVDGLQSDGTLAALQKKWLADTAGAPELR